MARADASLALQEGWTKMLEGFTPWPTDLAAQYREAGYWRGETIDDLLRRVAADAAERVAVIDGDRQLTYATLEDEVCRTAAAFARAGLRCGQTVVLQLPNRVEFVTVFFALQRLGVVPVLALPSHRSKEISHFCHIAGAAAYVYSGAGAGEDYRAVAIEVCGVYRDMTALRIEDLDGDTGVAQTPSAATSSDVAVLLVSGGTTGLPKLIPRTHDDYLYNARAAAAFVGLTEDDVYLAALPAAHNFTLACPGILGTLSVSGTVVLAANAAPDEVFELIESHRVTVTAAVPAAARVWAEATEWSAEDLSTLRLLQIGGARLLPEHAPQLREAFGPVVQQVFGMAEGLLNMTELDASTEVIDTTQGRPLSPGDEIRVVNDHDNDLPPGSVGQLLTRGPYTIRGYFRAPEHNVDAFTADGFYRSGDLVRLATTGHLVVEGRVKDQINRAGEKIATAEVEEALVGHPRVSDVAVVGLPDEILGERSCAFIILDGDAGLNLTRDEVGQHLTANGLAAYKIPDEIRVVDAFPVTGVGKTDKRALSSLPEKGDS